MREVLDRGNRTKQAGLLDMGNKQMPSHFRRAGLVVDPITTNQKAAGSSPAERAKKGLVFAGETWTGRFLFSSVLLALYHNWYRVPVVQPHYCFTGLGVTPSYIYKVSSVSSFSENRQYRKPGFREEPF